MSAPTWERSRPLAPFAEREVERFWAMVDKSGECWTWTGSLDKGYGKFGIKRDGRWVTAKAHRTAYEMLVGEIPQGLQLDHLCRVRSCVNPEHLEPVTNRENALRGESICAKHAAKTHCPRGHEYTPENTYVKPASCAGRECRQCIKIMQRQRAVVRLTGGEFHCPECPASFHELRFLRMHCTKVHEHDGNLQRVLLALIDAGERGLTNFELAESIDRTYRTVDVTAQCLQRDGLVARRLVLDPEAMRLIPDRRPAPSGAMAAVWVLAHYSQPQAVEP